MGEVPLTCNLLGKASKKVGYHRATEYWLKILTHHLRFMETEIEEQTHWLAENRPHQKYLSFCCSRQNLSNPKM